MNHGPFGLPPMVFSIGVLVVWLGGGLVVGVLMSRRKSYRRMLAATAASYQAQQLPGAQPWGDLVGVWHFKSAARWAGVICGVVLGIGVISIPLSMVTQPVLFEGEDKSRALLSAVAFGAVGLFLIVYSLWRPARAAQQCTVDRNLFITLGRRDREIPLDFRQYRYARMHVSQTRWGRSYPSMMVFDRDSPPGMGTLLSSMLFPRFDDGRIVLFHINWTTDEGVRIAYTRVDDFFIDTCRRAGYEPHFRRTWFTFGRPGWDVRADGMT
jgi:hypothetical protein